MSKRVVEIPADEQAEGDLIGCLLNDWTSFVEVCSFTEELFYDTRNRIIFELMTEFWARQEKPTLKDLWRLIEAKGKASYFEGYQYLRALVSDSLGMSLSTCLRKCVEMYQRRLLLGVADQIIDKLHKDDPSTLIDEVVGSLAKMYHRDVDKTYSLPDVLAGVDGNKPLIEVVQQERDQLIETGKIPMAGPSTGVTILDEYTRGLVKGSLIGVGAATGVGKSDFLARMIYSLITQEVHHMVFTLEMSVTEYAARLQAIAASVAPGVYLSRKMGDRDMDQVRSSDGLLRQNGHYCIMNGNSACTPEEVIMKTKREMVRNPLQVVIIDHLGLMENSNPRASDYERMGHSSRLLKKMALDLDVCVIEAAQFNRTQGEYGPTMNSFRDSGKVGEDMDNAFLIHRPNKESNPDDDYIELKLAKNRTGGGRLGRFQFDYNTVSGEWSARKPIEKLKNG